MSIKENVQNILSELQEGVELVIAAKARLPEEILEAVESGVKIVKCCCHSDSRGQPCWVR
jgi:hypothetical protein